MVRNFDVDDVRDVTKDGSPEIMDDMGFGDRFGGLTRMLWESSDMFVSLQDGKVSKIVRRRDPALVPIELDEPDKEETVEELGFHEVDTDEPINEEEQVNEARPWEPEVNPRDRWDWIFGTAWVKRLVDKKPKWIQVEVDRPILLCRAERGKLRLNAFFRNLLKSNLPGHIMFKQVQAFMARSTTRWTKKVLQTKCGNKVVMTKKVDFLATIAMRQQCRRFWELRRRNIQLKKLFLGTFTSPSGAKVRMFAKPEK